MPSQEQLAPTPVSQWKKAPGAKAVDLELPSGNIAKVRQIPMPDLLADGIFPDTLQGYVKKALGTDKEDKPGQPSDFKKKKSKKQGEAMSDADVAEMLKDPAKVKDMFSVFDKVLVKAVIEPKVHEVPEDEADRDDALLYVDEVDMQDKAFIFQFCVGGSKDLDRFRAESAPAVGGMADLAKLPSSS